MTHTEFHFMIENYITIIGLILLALMFVIFVFVTIIQLIKSKFDKYMNKKIDDEFKGADNK